jgi:hypothetical protein
MIAGYLLSSSLACLYRHARFVVKGHLFNERHYASSISLLPTYPCPVKGEVTNKHSFLSGKLLSLPQQYLTVRAGSLKGFSTLYSSFNALLGASLGGLPCLVHLATPANQLEDRAGEDSVGFL